MFNNLFYNKIQTVFSHSKLFLLDIIKEFYYFRK